MTVTDLKNEVSKLKGDISNLLTDFTNKTGVEVNYLTSDPVKTEATEVLTYDVRIDVKI